MPSRPRSGGKARQGGAMLSGQSRAAKANARAIEAKAMAAQGMTQKAIALALGVAQPTVSALLQRNISEP